MTVTLALSAEARAAQLDDARKLYQWDHGYVPGMSLLKEAGTKKPSLFYALFGTMIGSIPPAEDPSVEYVISHGATSGPFMLNQLLTERIGSEPAFNSLDEYKTLFKTAPKPTHALDLWPEDRFFVLQRVAGPNPVLIRRTERVSAKFAIDESRLKGVIPDGASLASLAGEGRLFMSDYGLLKDLPLQNYNGQPLACPASIALFYVENGELRPVAIQLGQTPGSDVYTPADGKAWLIARTLLQVADLNHHEMSTHLCHTHFVLETFAVAAARTLVQTHPIMVLLRQHFLDLIYNNFEGRELLVNDTGWASKLLVGGQKGSIELLKRSFLGFQEGDVLGWRPENWDLPLELKERGVDDSSVLQDYPFRDDGLLLWAAIGRFVREYVGVYYPSDAAVVADADLQAFAAELTSPQGGGIPGLAATIGSKEALAVLLQRIIFAAGPLHSAVNYPQYEYMAWAPQMPASAYAAPLPDMAQQSAATLDALLLKMLPPPDQARLQIFTVGALTSFRASKLGYYQKGVFSDPAVLAAVDRFQKDLASIERQIIDRNMHQRWLPYPYLQPSLVLNSTSI